MLCLRETSDRAHHRRTRAIHGSLCSGTPTARACLSWLLHHLTSPHLTLTWADAIRAPLLLGFHPPPIPSGYIIYCCCYCYYIYLLIHLVSSRLFDRSVWLTSFDSLYVNIYCYCDVQYVLLDVRSMIEC